MTTPEAFTMTTPEATTDGMKGTDIYFFILSGKEVVGMGVVHI